MSYSYLADLREDASVETIGQLGDAILGAFALRYARWQREGFSVFADEFAVCSFLAGKPVRIADMAGVITAEGTAIGADASGCLLVRTEAGATIPVSSGEAHIAGM